MYTDLRAVWAHTALSAPQNYLNEKSTNWNVEYRDGTKSKIGMACTHNISNILIPIPSKSTTQALYCRRNVWLVCTLLSTFEVSQVYAVWVINYVKRHAYSDNYGATI